jgi:hypothetical protein
MTGKIVGYGKNGHVSGVTAKKSPLVKAGLKLFSWRRIVETGALCCVARYVSNDLFKYALFFFDITLLFHSHSFTATV